MKVIINNHIIETDFIYDVSEIIKPAGNRKFNDAEWSGDNPSDWLTQFTIHFLNEKHLVFSERDIHLSKEDKIKYNGKTWDEVYHIKLTEARDKLIKIWTNNQSNIEKILF